VLTKVERMNDYLLLNFNLHLLTTYTYNDLRKIRESRAAVNGMWEVGIDGNNGEELKKTGTRRE